jgi:hypothetical protein
VNNPGPRSVCAGSASGAINFTGTGTSYTWTNTNTAIGLDSSGTGNITSFTALNQGVTPVTATITVTPVYTGGGVTCYGTPEEFVITVNPRPVPTISGLNPICSGSTGVIYTTEAGMSGYTWGISAGGTITSGAGTNQITVTWNVAGTQTLQVTYTDGNGCTPVSPTILSITVNQTPAMTITNPPAVCAPSTVNLTTVSISSTVPITTREYYSDAAATTSLANPEAISTSGTYYIKGFTAAGCFDIKPVTVTIHPEINLFITNPDPVCHPPATVDLTAAAITGGSTPGLSYTYWTDAAATIPLANYTTVNTSGTYYIKGTAGTSCFVIKPVIVTVNPTPTITTANTKTICSGQNTDITFTTLNNVPATFSWTVGTVTGTVTGATAGTGSTLSQVLTATGTGGSVQYLVTATGTEGNCPSPVYTITVTVGVPPNIITNPQQYYVSCEESYLDFVAGASGSPTMNIQWQLLKLNTTTWINLVNSGSEVQGANSNMLTLYIPKTTGQGEDYSGYQVRAIYTNNCGSDTTTLALIDVDKGTFVNRGPEITSGTCAGGPVTLWAKSNAGQNLTAQWQRFEGTNWVDIGPLWGPVNGTLEPTYTFISTAADDGARFRINYSGRCGNQNSEATIVFLNTIITAPNVCIDGGPVTFTQNGLGGGTWSVSGGGTITSTGEFTPTSVGCFSVTYQRGGCIDTKNFVVFPSTPTITLTGGANASCGARLPDIAALPAISGFIAEYAVQPPGGTLSAYGTLAAANTMLTNTIGCWTIKARYRLAANCGETLAGAVSSNMLCAEATLDAIVFPPKPVLTAPANTCNTAFTLPSVPSYTGFTIQYSINGATFTDAPTIPATPGCHTISARYILNAACGSTPAGADGGASCYSDPVSVVVFPPAPSAPEVSPGCGLFSVTPPPDIPGFTIQYSYDNGDTWETVNQGPSNDRCQGYDVKTRYVLAAACGITPAGTNSNNAACGESPATNRIVDSTPPVLICPTPDPDPVCVNNGDKYRYNGTGWDAFVDDLCLKSVSATLTGVTSGTYTTLNNVDFNIGLTIVTWTAYDGCNTASCSFTVTVNPVPVISNMTATICSGDMFSVTPEDGVNGIVPFGTSYSWSAPVTAGISETTAGSNLSVISGAPRNDTTLPIDVVYTIFPLSGDCSGSSFTVTVTVNPILECTITGPDGPVCPSSATNPNTLTYSAAEGMTNYSWSITGNATISGPTNQSTVTIITGQNCNETFTLTLNYNDTNGCSSDCEKTVTVLDDQNPTITQQPQNDSFECSSSDPDQNAAYLAWLANNGGATATDNCDNNLSWTNNSTTQPWVIDAVNHTRTKTVTFTATDYCLNSTVTQTATFTITDDVAPVIACPPSVEEQIAADLCSKTGVNIGTPTATDNCSTPTFSYTLTGVTTGAGNGLIPASQVFNVGVTTVTYAATDIVGNTATCQFTVWIKRLEIPEGVVTCPEDPNPVTVIADNCSAQVNLDIPIIDDPCNSIVSVVHDSPVGTPDNPSGIYPIGITIVTWTITDNSGNTRTCTQTVVVNDLPLICPEDIIEPALPLLDYANVNVPPPTFSSTCSGLTLTYTIELTDGTMVNSPATGINIVTSPDRFYIGVTTITYTLTHATGEVESCSFTVTVTSRPYITCPPDILNIDADPEECSALINPGIPTLSEGAQPIDWTWTMYWPDETTQIANGGSRTPDVGPTPQPIVVTDPHKYPFNVGKTTIVWTASNSSGSDQCTQTITVIDIHPPSVTLPDPIEECVENLILAVYNGSELDIQPVPDHYLHKAGTTNLDLSQISDNCACPDEEEMVIDWIITFDVDTPYGYGGTTLTGTGQPSLNDIYLWGDGVNFSTLIHTITYTLTDCNGNIRDLAPVNITITPRPQIIKN